MMNVTDTEDGISYSQSSEEDDMPSHTINIQERDQHDLHSSNFMGIGSDGGWRREASNASRPRYSESEDKRVLYYKGNVRHENYCHQEKQPKLITCDLLKTWAEMEDAGQLVLLMSSERHELETFMNSNKARDDWLDPLMNAVSHAITAQHQKESVKQLLDTLCRNHFFEHVTNYITEKQICQVVWNEAEDFFHSCLKILEEILNKLPQFANICITNCSALLNSCKCIESIQRDKALFDAITTFHKKAKEVFSAEREREKRSSGRLIRCNNSEQPPDNFLDIPVVPSEFDLREDANPFIRCAKITGGYEDIHQYLDIQFRLMRQDFILPLRKGIVEFKKSGCMKNFKSSDLRFYFDVHIIGTVHSEGIDHVLQFDISGLKNVSWELSKRLIFGSLLCLSKDNFETVLFATVAHHDVPNLAKGLVIVTFKTGLDDVFSSTSNDVYIMAETTAFFESYCHVLEGLQEMLTKLPLQDYIIHCKTEIQPPGYLLPSGGACTLPVYDISCLMKDQAESKVAVLTTVKWPKADVMCLNESQRQAAQLALTKELAIIQGPPGTGKTYVGLKVMQVLLENKRVMDGKDNKSSDPILVVCYTNHALDQFLEGVLKFCPDGIVRVGGRSKSEILDQFNLNTLRQKLRKRLAEEHKKEPLEKCIQQSIEECNKNCNMISDEISLLNKTMEILQTDIASEKVLERYMKCSHYDLLSSERAQSGNMKEKMINVWLKTSRSTTQSLLSKMIRQHLTMLVLKLKNVIPRTKILSSNMNIIQRAGFYHYYLVQYEGMFRRELHNMSTLPRNQVTMNEIQRVEDCVSAAQKRILSDEEICWVLSQGAFEMMFKYLKSAQRENLVLKYGVAETWILGLNKDLQSQLDDVETLISCNRQKIGDSGTFYQDDAMRKVQNDRMVGDDMVHIDKLNASIKSAFNNMTSIIQRADALGINDIMLNEDDDEESIWEIKSKPLKLRHVQNKLRLTEPLTEEQESSITDVWALKLDERFALYNLWVRRYKLTLTQKMQELVEKYKSVQDKKNEAKSEETLFLLRRAQVIGMTTTGAARHRAVLQALGCRIIVVEEAAEILESHIVTSLNKKCKHLILIGDHQQLRPSPNVYQLAKDFGLEISLFERLLKNKVPHVMLKEQHRMRPEISKIIRHIYPDLQDHPTVEEYESIRGVSKNLFFIQHEHKESHMDDSRSKANTHEATFLVALCQYLLNQDYSASQITILCTYSGQAFEIKKIMKEFGINPDILVTTVDNFQGEENDIILLSLVRSNTENNVGFLKVDNRVCVALSRAKEGLYVIGNFHLLASQSKLWNKIVKTADLEQIIGDGLPVICQNHPDFQELMTCGNDFKKCPEGGCGRRCQYRLQCGHVCALTCHGYDPEHTKYECQKPCTRICENGHPCKLKCYEDCNCRVLVIKQIPICGHDDQVPCCIPEDKAVCSQKCPSILDCDHQCSGICGCCRKSGKHEKCVVQVQYKWPCGHSEEVPCYIIPSRYPYNRNVCQAKLSVTGDADYCIQRCPSILDCDHQCSGICGCCRKSGKHEKCIVPVQYEWPCGHSGEIPCHTSSSPHPCQKVCGEKLDCGHYCKGKCFECLGGIIHVACGEKCDKLLPCGHVCASFCSVPCLPCTQACPNQCQHGACFMAEHMPLCSHACPPCKKKCSFKCRHLECGKYCSEICDIKSCDIKCNKNVPSCKHRCSGLCGELCVCNTCEIISKIHIKFEKSEEVSERYSEITEKPEKSEAIENSCQYNMRTLDDHLPFVKDAELNKDTTKSKRSKQRKRDRKNRLLLKLPSCSHIFYADELCKYVSDFDPNGSSYIPCPVCQCPILNCQHFENINKEKSRKREIEKAKVFTESDISEKQKADLLLSQKRLQNSTLLKEFRSLDVRKVGNIVELQAMSFKLKCAFMLDAICTVMHPNELSFTELLRTRKAAVLTIQGRLTNQQKKEFITELTRCFWLCYLDNPRICLYFKRLQDNELNAESQEILEALRKPNPSNDILERAEQVSSKKNRRIQEVFLMTTIKNKLSLLEETFILAMKIIRSRDNEMLCDLTKATDESVYPSQIMAIKNDVSWNVDNYLSHSHKPAEMPGTKTLGPYYNPKKKSFSSEPTQEERSYSTRTKTLLSELTHEERSHSTRKKTLLASQLSNQFMQKSTKAKTSLSSELSNKEEAYSSSTQTLLPSELSLEDSFWPKLQEERPDSQKTKMQLSSEQPCEVMKHPSWAKALLSPELPHEQKPHSPSTNTPPSSEPASEDRSCSSKTTTLSSESTHEDRSYSTWTRTLSSELTHEERSYSTKTKTLSSEPTHKERSYSTRTKTLSSEPTHKERSYSTKTKTLLSSQLSNQFMQKSTKAKTSLSSELSNKEEAYSSSIKTLLPSELSLEDSFWPKLQEERPDSQKTKMRLSSEQPREVMKHPSWAKVVLSPELPHEQKPHSPSTNTPPSSEPASEDRSCSSKTTTLSSELTHEGRSYSPRKKTLLSSQMSNRSIQKSPKTKSTLSAELSVENSSWPKLLHEEMSHSQMTKMSSEVMKHPSWAKAVLSPKMPHEQPHSPSTNTTLSSDLSNEERPYSLGQKAPLSSELIHEEKAHSSSTLTLLSSELSCEDSSWPKLQLSSELSSEERLKSFQANSSLSSEQSHQEMKHPSWTKALLSSELSCEQSPRSPSAKTPPPSELSSKERLKSF